MSQVFLSIVYVFSCIVYVTERNVACLRYNIFSFTKAESQIHLNTKRGGNSYMYTYMYGVSVYLWLIHVISSTVWFVMFYMYFANSVVICYFDYHQRIFCIRKLNANLFVYVQYQEFQCKFSQRSLANNTPIK